MSPKVKSIPKKKLRNNTNLLNQMNVELNIKEENDLKKGKAIECYGNDVKRLKR